MSSKILKSTDANVYVRTLSARHDATRYIHVHRLTYIHNIYIAPRIISH